jgi:hypothetical protein
MKIKKLTALLVGVLLIGLVSCEYVTIEPKVIVIPNDPVLFATQVAPMFTEAGCNGCHGNGATPDFSTPAKAYSSITGNDLVDTTNPAASVIMVKINAGHGTAGNLSATQKALLLKWIEQGAQNN